MELLHSHTTTHSHRSSGSTVCFLLRGAEVRILGMHPHFWNWDYSVRIVSRHGWPWHDPWSPATIGPLTLTTGCFSHPSCPSSILTAGHRFMWHTAWIPALRSSCILTPLHNLTGPVGQPFASWLRGQQLASQGCTHISGIGILLLALSRYKLNDFFHFGLNSRFITLTPPFVDI